MADKNIEMIKRLERSSVLLNVLLSFEEYLDNLDIYAFKNWFKGEVVQGPEIERYWVHVVLRYSYNNMPDPQGGLRLMKHGCKVKYVKAKQKFVNVELDDVVNIDNDQNVDFVSPSPVAGRGFTDDPHDRAKEEGQIQYKPIWLIIITMPRRFIDDVTEAGLDDYAETVDTEDVSDARDEGMTDDNIVNQEDEMEDEMSGDENEGSI